MPLNEFCSTIVVTNQGTHRRITDSTELHDLYSRLCCQHEKTKQHSKTSCFQNPAVRYFVYYLSSGVLARESTSTTPSPDLAIMLAVVDKDYTYSVGAQIARRIHTNSVKGRTFGGIVASRTFFAQNVIPIAPNDVLLPPRRLDFNTLKLHNFFESKSTYGNFSYRVLLKQATRNLYLFACTVFV